jgi:hypothetical protein
MEDISSEACTRDTDTELTSAQVDSDNMEATTSVTDMVDSEETADTDLVDTVETEETDLEVTKETVLVETTATSAEVETLEDIMETTYQDRADVQAADQLVLV